MELNPSSPAVQAIPIEECGEPLVDIRQAGGLLYGPPPECEHTEPDYTRLRLSVYNRLLKAQSLLPDGLKFRLYEGYRSLNVQGWLFDQERQRVQARNPDLSDEALWLETTRLVSAPFTFDGKPNTPPHSTGAAVDLEIIDAQGNVIDFGMEVGDWINVTPALCRTETEGLSDIARSNRELLVTVMSGVGFVNYPEEWWHFSYGDQFWACLSDQPNAIYGRIDS